MNNPVLRSVPSICASNFRDPVATLRRIADEIEAGEYGGVGSAAIVILGDTMEVFGMGEDSEPASVALLLHAGFLRLSGAVESHGRDEAA
jgi:hypothetical protein